MSTLSERIRMALKGPPKITQKALADACGVKPPSISDWLSGRTKKIEGANLLSAARFLNVRPEWLATGKGDMRSSTAIDLVTNVDSDLQELIDAYRKLSQIDKIKFKSSIKNNGIKNKPKKVQGNED